MYKRRRERNGKTAFLPG